MPRGSRKALICREDLSYIKLYSYTTIYNLYCTIVISRCHSTLNGRGLNGGEVSRPLLLAEEANNTS